LALALALAGGCAGVNGGFSPDALSGMLTPKPGQTKLEEARFPPEAARHAAASAPRTLDAPVRLNVPGRTVDFAVNSVKSDLFATPYVRAIFPGGKIVEREFGKVLAANFREPMEGETPVAELGVRIAVVSVAQKSDSAPMSSSLKINVEIVKADGKGTAYEGSIETAATAPWTNRALVPDSFYKALSEAIERFLDEWDRSGGPDAVARWTGEATPGLVPPELRDIEWTTAGKDVQRGRCTIVCNGWEGFRAKHWANAQIAVACRTKLGNIEPERVRVVYDAEEYDAAHGEWTFAFRCFARTEKVLDFNAATGQGTVIGDLGLLQMTAEEAANVLKAYVLKEMQSHSGIVTSGQQTAEAFVRFDDYKTDKACNLIAIDFRLLQ
jgi:hypothetical protein